MLTSLVGRSEDAALIAQDKKDKTHQTEFRTN